MKENKQSAEVICIELNREEKDDYARSLLAAMKNQSASVPLDSKHLYYLCDLLEQVLEL